MNLKLALAAFALVLSLCAPVSLSQQCNFGDRTELLSRAYVDLIEHEGVLEQNERLTDRKLGREVLDFMLHYLRLHPEHDLAKGQTGLRSTILQYMNRVAPLKELYERKLAAEREVSEIEQKIGQLNAELEKLASTINQVEEQLGFSTELKSRFGMNQIQYAAYRPMRTTLAKCFHFITQHSDGLSWIKQWVQNKKRTLFDRTGYKFLRKTLNLTPDMIPGLLEALDKTETERGHIYQQFQNHKSARLQRCNWLMKEIGTDAARVKQCKAYRSFDEARSLSTSAGIVYFIRGSGGWYAGITTKTLSERYPSSRSMTSSLKEAIGDGSYYAIICKPTDPSSIKPVDEVIAHNHKKVFTNTR